MSARRRRAAASASGAGTTHAARDGIGVPGSAVAERLGAGDAAIPAVRRRG